MAGLISMVSCPSMGVGMGMSKTSCSSGGSWSLQNHNQSYQVAALRVGGGSDRRNGRGDIVVRSGTQEEKVVVVSIGQVTEVNKDTFWPLVKAASHTKKIVVLDMYTQWCGPCKVMAPKFKVLSEKYDDVVFLKLDCNQENKSLAKELGIKVVPTFKILKDCKIVKEVTGAKFDDLVGAIEIAKSN